MLKAISRSYQGFTLIEVLVSMVIMATGLLGLAMLQGRALSTNQDAFLYGQANLLIYEMNDRIKANKAYWIGTTVPTVAQIAAAKADDVDGTPACTKTGSTTEYICTPPNMAAYDVYYWQTTVAALMPTATAAIVRIPATSTSACVFDAMVTCLKPSLTVANNCIYDVTRPTSLCLTISWDSKSPNADGTAHTATQQLGMTP